jgi:polyhydroxybutyrate depolymerase
MLSRDWFRSELQAQRVLGIVMDGVSNTWAHVGSPSARRDEIVYLEEVLDDVSRRYDLDPDRLWVSGHSQGGSMAWDAACYAGNSFAAAFPVSGAFWEPLPAACPGAPLAFRHTHGLADTTVPLEGRPIGGWRQGDVPTGIELWRQENGCADEPDRLVVDGPSTCQVWDQCGSGDDLWFCLHEGAHKVPGGWLRRNLDWAASLAP